MWIIVSSMRSNAKKVKIEDLVNGDYTHSPEGEPNFLITPWDQKLLRVNLIATVIDRFIRDDEEYGTLHLDDGSGTIRAKAWSEGVEELKEFEIGDLVRTIGKIREYEGEIHLVPEVIRKLDDPNWELVHEMEVLEIKNQMLEEGKIPDYGEESEEEKEQEAKSFGKTKKPEKTGTVEKLGEPEDLGEEKEVSEDLKDKLLLALDKLEGEDGATVSDLAAEIDKPTSKTEEALGVLLNEDKIYEPIAGKFKRLG